MWLKFRVIDIGRDHGAAARNLVADKFRRDESWHLGAKALALSDLGLGIFKLFLTAKILALGDIDHLLGDDPGFGIFELGQRTIACPAQWSVPDREFARQIFARGAAIILRADFTARIGFHMSALEHPIGTVAGETFLDINRHAWVGIRARCVIDRHRRFIRGRVQINHPARHGQ